jgi:hypothetical protein
MCPAHLILLDLIAPDNISWAEEIINSILQLPPSHLSPRVFLGNLFANTLSLCTCLNVRDQVSHPFYKTI